MLVRPIAHNTCLIITAKLYYKGLGYLYQLLNTIKGNLWLQALGGRKQTEMHHGEVKYHIWYHVKGNVIVYV